MCVGFLKKLTAVLIVIIVLTVLTAFVVNCFRQEQLPITAAHITKITEIHESIQPTSTIKKSATVTKTTGVSSVRITWKPRYSGPSHLFSLPHRAHAVAENLVQRVPTVTYFSVICLLGVSEKYIHKSRGQMSRLYDTRAFTTRQTDRRTEQSTNVVYSLTTVM